MNVCRGNERELRNRGIYSNKFPLSLILYIVFDKLHLAKVGLITYRVKEKKNPKIDSHFFPPYSQITKTHIFKKLYFQNLSCIPIINVIIAILLVLCRQVNICSSQRHKKDVQHLFKEMSILIMSSVSQLYQVLSPRVWPNTCNSSQNSPHLLLSISPTLVSKYRCP